MRAAALVDAAVCGIVVSIGLAALVPYALLLRVLRQSTGPRRIVYLGTGRIAQVFPRNGANLFLERECSDFDGYFEHLWNVHFPAGGRGSLDLTPRHHLVDVDFPIPKAAGRRTATALREVRFLFWLVRFLCWSRASIVTATNPYLQGLHAALAGRLLALPYAVIITRDFDWDWRVLHKQAFASVFPSRAVERAVGRWVLRHASLVLADREYYRQFALRNGAAPERAVATRVLADDAYAHAVAVPDIRARLGLDDGPLLLYVGRLDADKFVFDLVDCLALVRQRFPSARLACAGRGALEDAMRERATRQQVGDGLCLLGTLPLDDLAALLASSDVVVAPHMGYTLVEAGLTGTPVVTYDYDFAPEIIDDGVSGCLAPFRDVRALAACVCTLLEQPAHARVLGQRLRERLLREHRRDVVIPLYRAAYERVFGTRSTSGQGSR